MAADGILQEIENGISSLFKEEKDGLVTDSNAYDNIQKATVLQAARDFHDSTIVRDNPHKCINTITQLLYIQQNTSQCLQRNEATDVFFGATKLFICKDPFLRRMLYIFFKEIYVLCDPSDVIIVTSCLTKDMTCDVDLYRANALRVLARIIDSSMLGAIERYVKQAIMDNSHIVSRSALVSSIFLFRSSSECAAIIRRWVSEVQEALKSPDDMVQYHATQLYYLIKAHDRMSVSKFVQTYTIPASNNSSNKLHKIRSHLALISFIRFTTKLLLEELTSGTLSMSNLSQHSGYKFLQKSLRHETQLVSYEAARAISLLPNIASEYITAPLSVLHILLSSPKPSVRFGAVKTLCSLSSLYPHLVSKVNEDLEALIRDPNRLVGTLCIMTLLKTSNEQSLDRILKSISSFLRHIAEEYKIMIVQSLELLSLTYPARYATIIGFLSSFLREEGKFKFKQTIVNAIISLVHSIPECTELALLYLCEFIEDCESNMLCTQILHFVGEQASNTTCPAHYVRYVYNRVILENSIIRSAAVTTLGKLGASCPNLRPSIITLLKSCVADNDDETRDRACLALTILEDAVIKCPWESPSIEDIEDGKDGITKYQNENDPAFFLMNGTLPISFKNLERRLKSYQNTPGSMDDNDVLTFDSLPVLQDVEDEAKKNFTTIPISNSEMESNAQTDSLSFTSRDPSTAIRDFSSLVLSIPEFATFGKLFQSTAPIALTELETEYVVKYIKHIFPKHVVLQFIVENTIEDQRLENLSVSIDCDEAKDGFQTFEVVGEIPATVVHFGIPAHSFTVLQRNDDESMQPISSYTYRSELKFSVVNVNTITGEDEGEPYDEDYALENVEIFVKDFISKTQIKDFKSAWENMSADHEVLQKFALKENNLETAVATVVDCFGMYPCDGTGVVQKGHSKHMIHLSGTFQGGFSVLVRAQVQVISASASSLKVAIRSNDRRISGTILECI